MKTVYLVRHGETDANKTQQLLQGADQPLNETGRRQAQVIAARAMKLTFDRLFASTMQRAVETASYIAEHTGREVELSDLFREMRPPTSLSTGESTEAKIAEAVRYRELRSLHAHDVHWHYEDEENAADLFTRVEQALAFLAKAPGDSFLVVTHATFLKMVIGHVMSGGTSVPADFSRYRDNLQAHNTGLSMLILQDGVWRVRCFNDYAHFADD